MKLHFMASSLKLLTATKAEKTFEAWSTQEDFMKEVTQADASRKNQDSDKQLKQQNKTMWVERYARIYSLLSLVELDLSNEQKPGFTQANILTQVRDGHENQDPKSHWSFPCIKRKQWNVLIQVINLSG